MLLISRDKFSLVDALGNAIAQLIGVAEDVLCLFKSNRVRGKIKRGFAIQAQGGRAGNAETDILQEVSNED